MIAAAAALACALAAAAPVAAAPPSAPPTTVPDAPCCLKATAVLPPRVAPTCPTCLTLGPPHRGPGLAANGASSAFLTVDLAHVIASDSVGLRYWGEGGSGETWAIAANPSVCAPLAPSAYRCHLPASPNRFYEVTATRRGLDPIWRPEAQVSRLDATGPAWMPLNVPTAVATAQINARCCCAHDLDERGFTCLAVP